MSDKSSNYLPTESLRTFILVAELGSFTQAAQRLGRTQPAITLQIQKLEASLDQQIFRRSNNALHLTQAGETLLGYAKRIISLHDELQNAFSGNSLSGKLRFGIPSEFATTLLPAIISRFAKDHPNVTLDVTCDLSKNLISAANKYHYDLILALHNDDQQQDLVTQEDLVWVSHRNVHIKAGATVPLIVAPEGCIYRRRTIQILEQHNIDWRIVYTIPDLTGIQAAIEAGLGITVLSKSTVPNKLKILSQNKTYLPELGQVGISLISKNRSQAVQKLIQYIQQNLQNH